VASNCYKRVAGLEQLRKQKDAISEHIALLQEERTELVAKKKTLDVPQAQKLTELEAQLAALQPLPQYLSTYARLPFFPVKRHPIALSSTSQSRCVCSADEHDDMSNRLTTLLLDATLEKATELDVRLSPVVMVQLTAWLTSEDVDERRPRREARR
jgi:hypothetical protein